MVIQNPKQIFILNVFVEIQYNNRNKLKLDVK